MTRGVRWYLVSSLVLVALIALAGCSHYLMAEREPWRHEAELTCLNSGAVKELAGRVRISAITGGGACGIDYPLRVSELGQQNGSLGYDDETLRPPGAIPDGAMPQHWPGAQSSTVQSSTLSTGAGRAASLPGFAVISASTIPSGTTALSGNARVSDRASRPASFARSAGASTDGRQ